VFLLRMVHLIIPLEPVQRPIYNLKFGRICGRLQGRAARKPSQTGVWNALRVPLLQFLGFAYANPAGFPLQSLASHELSGNDPPQGVINGIPYAR
jgi:hypothetical protein